MIHRSMNLPFVSLEPNIVFLTLEQSPSSFYSVWKAGNLADPDPFSTTRISSLNGLNDHLADPELSPDGTQVIYSRVGHNLTPKETSVRKVDWGDTTNVQLYREAGGATASMQPSWKPDGTKIVFRAKGGSTPLILIKHMDPDGTNVATLYTGAAQVENPTYSYDGARIAWVEGATVKAMNADGTNVTTVWAPGGTHVIDPYVAWANASRKLAVRSNDSSAFTSTERWRTVNDDGTGLTLIHSVSRATGYGPSDGDPGFNKWTWMPDDSALATTIHTPSDPVPNHVLTKIMADSSGQVDFSPERLLNSASSDARPAVFGSRVYFPDANPTFTQLSSILTDGSDYRTDFDGSAETPATVVFHGFKGNTVNV